MIEDGFSRIGRVLRVEDSESVVLTACDREGVNNRLGGRFRRRDDGDVELRLLEIKTEVVAIEIRDPQAALYLFEDRFCAHGVAQIERLPDVDPFGPDVKGFEIYQKIVRNVNPSGTAVQLDDDFHIRPAVHRQGQKLSPEYVLLAGGADHRVKAGRNQ